jgi:hypothetical protein
VTWCKRSKKWQSYITLNRKSIHLGYFDDIDDAQQARKQKAIRLFGCYINKVEIHNH